MFNHKNPNRASSPPRGRRGLQVVTALSAALMPALASASPWELTFPLDGKGKVSQKVELVDINADSFVDVVFANSSGNEVGNDQDAQINQLWVSDAGAAFNEVAAFDAPDNAYVIKAADVDVDGDPDLVVGVNFAGVSYVLLNDGGTFTRLDILGGLKFSIGDLEIGDLDGDNDLDILAADWGMSQPYGDPDDLGGPVRLWLGDGTGMFTDGSAMLPMGMENLASWSFDLELVDFDNDNDLDALISTRGFGKALVFQNDGSGTFSNYAVPALQPMTGKNVNVAFSPIDLNDDEFPDVITLQDGAGGGGCVEIDGDQYCAKRNSVLINDKMGQFADNPGAYWDVAFNPPKLDFDAASLDFNNDGKPDFVVTGLRLGGNDNNSRLMLNDGAKITTAPAPNDAAFPVVPELGKSFGLAFADFNNDRRVDAAVAVRDGQSDNQILLGVADDAMGVPLDTTPPRLGPHEVLKAPLFFGKEAAMRGRGHDYKTPTQWHDYQFDPMLGTYNLTEGSISEHNRRVPYMEFALSLANPDDLKALADDDPQKYISPSVWLGEALWRVAFKVPYNGKKMDTLTWQFCAIDAAGNKSCLGPFQVEVTVDPTDCGNGMVEPWETCDDPGDPLCVECENTCGNGVCDPNEDSQTCPEDCGPCDNDGVCEPPENNMNCPNDCPCDNDGMCEPPENEMNCPNDCSGGTASDTDGCGNGVCDNGETEETCPEDCPPDPTVGPVCGDDVCEAPAENPQNCPEDCHCGNNICEANLGEDEMTCPADCGGDSATDTACPDSGGAGECQLDDDHPCNCKTQPGDTRGLWASLLLLGAFGVRRRRRA